MKLCPRCQISILYYDQNRFSEALAQENQIIQLRQAAAVESRKSDIIYRVRVRSAIIFWAILIIVFLGLGIIVVLSYAS